VSRKRVITVLVLLILVGAVWALTNYQRGRKVKELLGQLSDADQLKTMEAMEQLRHRARFVAPRLLENLKSPDPAVRWRSAMLAAEIRARSPEVRDQLIVMLSDKDTSVQRAAVVACGRLKLAQAEGPLSRIVVARNEDPNLRAMAAASLGMIGSPASVKGLAAVLGEHPPVPPKEEAREKGTAGAKTETAKPAPKPAEDKTWQLRMECALALGQIASAEAVEPLVSAVRDDVEPKADVRMAAAYALADLGRSLTDQTALGKAVQGLIEAMGDETGDVRVAAAMGLSQVYPPKSARAQVEQVLRDHMDDDHYWVREAVKYAARQLGVSASG